MLKKILNSILIVQLQVLEPLQSNNTIKINQRYDLKDRNAN